MTIIGALGTDTKASHGKDPFNRPIRFVRLNSGDLFVQGKTSCIAGIPYNGERDARCVPTAITCDCSKN